MNIPFSQNESCFITHRYSQRSNRNSWSSDSTDMRTWQSGRRSGISGSPARPSSARLFSVEPTHSNPGTGPYDGRRQHPVHYTERDQARSAHVDHVGRWWFEHASLSQLLERALSRFGGHEGQTYTARDVEALIQQMEALESELAATRASLTEARVKIYRYRRYSATLQDIPARLSDRVSEYERRERDISTPAQALELLNGVVAEATVLKRPVGRLDTLIGRISSKMRARN